MRWTILVLTMVCLLSVAQPGFNGPRSTDSEIFVLLKPANQAIDLADVLRQNDSALSLHHEGKNDEALTIITQAMALAQKSAGPDHSVMATLSTTAGRIYLAKQQFRGAERALRRAVEIRDKAFGVESVEAAQSLFNLAEYYQITADFKHAAILYERVLKTRERLLKAGDVDTVVTAFRYGCVLRKERREQEATAVESRSQLNDDKSIPSKGQGLIIGKLIESPEPVRTIIGRPASGTEKVTVQVLIDEAGFVINACALSGDPRLWQTSEAAAYQSRFTPTTISGVRIRAPGTLYYHF